MNEGLRSNEHARLRVVRSEALPEHLRERVREVVGIETDPNHLVEGYAGALLRHVCAEADAASMALLVSVAPFGVKAMGRADLIAWYTRLGFALIQTQPAYLMVRTPKFTHPQAVEPETETVH